MFIFAYAVLKVMPPILLCQPVRLNFDFDGMPEDGELSCK